MYFIKSLKAFLMGMLLTGAVLAEDSDKMAWEKFEPPPDKKYDWIQMNSGEWLKGEIKVMYNYTLEFDSDELDLLELDMDDVKQIRSANNQRILVERGRRNTAVLSGRLIVSGEEVQLIQKDSTNELKRVELVSIAGGSKRELDNWSGTISFGATARGGNTETIDVNTSLNIRRRTAMTRLNVDYFANYSEVQTADVNGVKTRNRTTDNHRLNGYFDWFLTSRFYWQIVNAEYYRDPFANIQHQYSLNTAVGYDLIRTSRTEWTCNLGAGYQETKFESVPAGEDQISRSPFGTLGTRLDYEINGDTDFLFDYSARVLNKSNGAYTHHLVTTLSYEVIADLDLDVSFVWDHIQHPQGADDGAGGIIYPEKDDYQIIVGVGYDF